MANEEQLRLLKEKGVEAWNEWRRNLDSNRDVKIDLAGADLAGADLSDAEIGRANLSGADLSDAHLNGNFLSDVNLSDANLMRANFRGATLAGADLSGANLSDANLSDAHLSNLFIGDANLSGANLSGADLSDAEIGRANLSGANLSGADLEGTNFSRANLKYANLEGVDLSETNFNGEDLSKTNFTNTNLTRIQALGTNFKSATLTGACIEDWNINSDTNFENVICDYIYLKEGQQERRPAGGNFAPGEFAKLVETSIETVDLIFKDGIDWKAFLSSFQDLRVEYAEENVSIQAIENKSDGAFVIRLNVPSDVDKAEVESKAIQSYETKLKVLEAQYREKLEAKDEQIAIYRQHNTDLLDIIRLKANQPITENHFHSSVGSVDNKGIQTNIAGEVKGDQSN